MHVDTTGSFTADPLETEQVAVTAEKEGYDGVSVPETAHDAFIALGLAARATSRIRLQSGIAVAFARNPMTLAYQANDVALLSGGRFDLGIGSQVKPHIERRFSMPWSNPAARMEDFIRAVRAIWESWATGDRLRYQGEFYSHTLMTEFFSPGPNPHGNPPIHAGRRRRADDRGRGPGDRRDARALADHTVVHVRGDRAGAASAAAGATTSTASTSACRCSPCWAPTPTPAPSRSRASAARSRSTAPRRRTGPVLEHHGWGELADRLNGLSRQQAWDEMADLIDDDVLDAFAVAGSPDEVASAMVEALPRTGRPDLAVHAVRPRRRARRSTP